MCNGETDCVGCPFVAGIQALTKHHRGCSMYTAVRTFIRSRVAKKKAKRIIEESIGMPLEVAQTVLRESHDE